ncbi:hypothetical protein O7606_21440 [Micromonospora sp. WMMD882]|uniref:hypothetical protein n=1 Tax=Micromonospora sp. WMMD882 TaxID=3015151 RepID=UPI00248D390D|nr:hypothetical protein [Micromonospora sp. WMMD882]WBB78753.1 hypothetical protein O7606_21440 [Micromonospora sp. WMMD882]
MLRRLELLGRFTLDPQGSGIDVDDAISCIMPFWEDVRADRDGFLTDLRTLTAPEPEGFATLGAAHLVWELVGEEALRVPAAWPLIDGGIDFKLSRGLSTASLTGYEMQRLVQRRMAND